MLEITAVKLFLPWITAFLLGFLFTPYILKQLVHFRCWKRTKGNEAGMGDDDGTPIFNKLHEERDVRVPRMGGLVIVASVCATIGLFWLISFVFSGGPSGEFDLLSRSQTWLPFTAFIAGALIGFIDDILTIGLTRFVPGSKGLALRYRMIWATIFATGAAYWFYVKLGVDTVAVPLYGDFSLGIWFVPFFILAFVVIVGATLSFLWFNIQPAKFYMTEVGYNALSFSLAIVAFATDSILILPFLAIALSGTLLTTVMQILSKKIRKKKIFVVAPVHHHFEAIGWPAEQIVMRYWIVSIIAAVLGVVLAFTV